MHETSGKLAAGSDTDPASVRTSILEVINVSQVCVCVCVCLDQSSSLYLPFVDVVQVTTSNPEVLMFAGVTFSSSLPLLITINLGAKVTINSEKMVINGMLLKVVQKALAT